MSTARVQTNSPAYTECSTVCGMSQSPSTNVLWLACMMERQVTMLRRRFMKTEQWRRCIAATIVAETSVC